MSSQTEVLGLLKKDPAADADDTFNIRTMLNDNWDHIDRFAGVDADVARTLHLSGDHPNGKDALRKLIPRVGDTLTTAGAAPSEDWAPCDGSAFRAAELPELSAILRQRCGAVKQISGSGIAYDGADTLLAVGRSHCYYSLDRGVTWAETAPSGSAGLSYIDAAYGDGKWVVMCSNQIFTAADVRGPWTRVIGSPSVNIQGRIFYSGDQWMICASSGRSVLVYTASAPDSAWSSETVYQDGMSVGTSYFCRFQSFGGTAYLLLSVSANSEVQFIYARADAGWTRVLSLSQSGGTRLALGCNGGAGASAAYVLALQHGASLDLYKGQSPDTLSYAATLTLPRSDQSISDLLYIAGEWLLFYNYALYAAAQPEDLAPVETLPTAIQRAVPIGAGDWAGVGSAAAVSSVARNFPSVDDPVGLTTYIKTCGWPPRDGEGAVG